MAKYFTKEGDEFKEVDENLLTQADVDKVVETRLERDRKNKFGDYDVLKEKAGKVDSITKEYEDKLKEKDTVVSTLTADLGKAKLETDKVKIIHEFKLSDELHEFVTGDTADEMRQRAEKLAKGIKGGSIKIDKDKKPSGAETDSKKLASKLFGGSKSDD